MESIKIENKTTEQHFKEKAVSASTKRRFGRTASPFDRTHGDSSPLYYAITNGSAKFIPRQHQCNCDRAFYAQKKSRRSHRFRHHAYINCRVCADNIATTGHKSIFKRIEALCPP